MNSVECLTMRKSGKTILKAEGTPTRNCRWWMGSIVRASIM